MTALGPILGSVLGPVTSSSYSGDDSQIFVTTADGYRADTAAASMSISTPDGGNELVHPSIFDSIQVGMTSWNGKRYWMAATPYAGSDASIENPCIYASDSLDGPWAAPVGLTNPITPSPGMPAFNSDTHLVFPGDGYLYCFYRVYDPAAVGAEEKIVYKRSADGVVWEAAVTSLSNNQATRRLVSPAIEWDGAQWVMYAVDIVPSPNNIVRLTSPTLVSATWSAPSTVTVSPTFPTGRECWHLDAKYRNGYWWLLIQDTPSGGSSGGNLYLCRADGAGTNFTRPSVGVMTPFGNWHDLCYRSCLISTISGGKLAFEMIYTGINASVDYFLGHTTINSFDTSAYAAEPAAAIAGAAASTAPYLIGDNFNRADGALGTSTGGEVWTVSAAVPGIVSNQAAATTAANTRAFLEAGSSDGYFEESILHTAALQSYLVVRLADGSNYWRIGFSAADLVAQKIVAGAATSLRSATNAYTIMGSPASIRLGARLNGSTITIMVEGKVAFSFTDAFNNTATKAGFQCNNTSQRFDNIWGRSLVGGV